MDVLLGSVPPKTTRVVWSYRVEPALLLASDVIVPNGVPPVKAGRVIGPELAPLKPMLCNRSVSSLG